MDCYFFFQVVRRLRERGEPIRLFGESDHDVCIRLRYVRSANIGNYVIISNSTFHVRARAIADDIM